MNKRLDALRNSPVFAEERIVARAQAELNLALEKRGWSRADLAKKMGVSKGRVSQIFSDKQNFTIRLLARAFHALDMELHLQAWPQGVEIKSCGEPDVMGHVYWAEEPVGAIHSQEFEHFGWDGPLFVGALNTADAEFDFGRIIARSLDRYRASETSDVSKLKEHFEPEAAEPYLWTGKSAENVLPFYQREKVA